MAQASLSLRSAGLVLPRQQPQSSPIAGRQLSDSCCRFPFPGKGFARPTPNHSPNFWEHSARVSRESSAVRASRESDSSEGEPHEGGKSGNLENASVGAGKTLEARQLDKIELAAKTSIDKLRHIIYKLQTQAPSPKSTIISSSSDIVVASGSARAKIEGRDEKMFIKQDFEVEVGPFEEEGADGMDTSPPDAEAFVHHDSLTCTQTAVRIDEKTGTAVVTVTATVRGAEIIDQGVALAARALARTCLALDEKAQAALSGAETVLQTLPKLTARPHDLLIEVLQDGQIGKFAPVVGGGGSPLRQQYEVELEIPGWSTAKAVFKPAVPGDAFLRWRRAPQEWVAYQMNLLLGLDICPPAAIRTNVQLGGETFDLGVMVLAVEGLRPLSSIPTEEWGVPSPASLVSSAHVLDALVGGAPRQPHDFYAGKHWSLKGGLKPVLLEHPMGPSRGALHSMWSHRGELRGVKSISVTTMARLKELSHSLLFEQLSGALTSDEMELILERRDQIVAYFEAMAKRHGQEAVLV